jgi:hypothetical protein
MIANKQVNCKVSKEYPLKLSLRIFSIPYAEMH